MDNCNTFRITCSIINNKSFKMVAVDAGSQTAFMGFADKESINIITTIDRMSQLLIRAVNNRTRERNYFRLCNQLLEKEISDEEFDKEIEEHEDEYVVTNNEEASLEDIRTAVYLSKSLKDVNDVDDMADLFSFSSKSIRESLQEK